MPPKYDLAKITVPFAIGQGDLDTLADVNSVAWLLDQSQSGLNVKDLMIFHKLYHFGHGTYSLALDGSFLYDDFVPLIKKMTESYKETLE